jgi:hypothetical protein
MMIYVIDCRDLDECYAKKSSNEYLNKLVIDESDEGEMELERFKQKQELLKSSARTSSKGKGDTASAQYKGKHDLENPVGDESDSDDDKDNVNIISEDGGDKLLTPVTFNKMEQLDNGITWSYKRRLHVKQHHLVVCYSSNDVGDLIVTKIVIPSDIEKGKPFAVSCFYSIIIITLCVLE